MTSIKEPSTMTIAELNQHLFYHWDILGKVQKEVNKRLSAGEQAVKKVAELEKRAESYGNYDSKLEMREAELLDRIAELEKEVERLTRWKKEMLLVESSWNVQEIAKILNIEPGTNIRKNILPCIIQLKQQAAAGQRAVEAMEKMIIEFQDGMDEKLFYEITNDHLLNEKQEFLQMFSAIQKDIGLDKGHVGIAPESVVLGIKRLIAIGNLKPFLPNQIEEWNESIMNEMVKKGK